MPANSKQVPSGFSMMPQALLCYNTTDLGVLRFRAKTLSVSRQTNHFLDTSAIHKKNNSTKTDDYVPQQAKGKYALHLQMMKGMLS